MDTINVVEAKKNFSDLMGRVAYGGQRLVIERHGKSMIAWISIEDLRRLEALENNTDAIHAKRDAALKLADSARQRVREERKGLPLLDSTEVLYALREGSLDE